MAFIHAQVEVIVRLLRLICIRRIQGFFEDEEEELYHIVNMDCWENGRASANIGRKAKGVDILNHPGCPDAERGCSSSISNSVLLTKPVYTTWTDNEAVDNSCRGRFEHQLVARTIQHRRIDLADIVRISIVERVGLRDEVPGSAVIDKVPRAAHVDEDLSPLTWLDLDSSQNCFC